MRVEHARAKRPLDLFLDHGLDNIEDLQCARDGVTADVAPLGPAIRRVVVVDVEQRPRVAVLVDDRAQVLIHAP
ncbi:MAG: hypothetical protein K8M05_38585 [Deltaproteobacteria bacterium]|nr:hypothetical protein [Kofleriaceae bacterium]